MSTENPIQPQTQPEPQAPALRSGDLFGDFERNAAASAHLAAAQRHDKLASDRREWAKERGPIWQRYLAQALLCERKARQHRERARSIFASPNAADHARPLGAVACGRLLGCPDVKSPEKKSEINHK